MLLHDETAAYAAAKSGRFESLAELLRAKLPGMSQRKMARKLGVDNATVARWLSAEGVQPTSMEKCLRIARACGVDPREVFALVGLLEDFGPLWDFYHGRVPTIEQFYDSDEEAGRLMQRADRILRRGWRKRFDSKLRELESYWEVNRSAFQSLAENLGAKAAFLVLQHPGSECDIIYSLDCKDGEARQVMARSGPPPWRSFDQGDSRLRLQLFLKGGAELEEAVVEVLLAGWFASFKALFAAE